MWKPWSVKAQPHVDVEPNKVYRDVISGYEGTATCQYSYANGCIRYELSGVDEKGQPATYVFDEQQLEAVNKPSPVTAPPARRGGDRSITPVAR